MTPDEEDLRLAVYHSFAALGRAPGPDDLAEDLDLLPDEVRDGLRALAAERHLVLDPRDRVVMAHPFSAVNLGFSVMGRRTLWWGGCAWDSFAMPHLVPGEDEVLVATRCPACATPHAWSVGRDGPPPGGQVAHFLVPAARMWDDVVHTCGNQRIFCDRGCVDAWLADRSLPVGAVLDLVTLWRLASRWYEGRLGRGYTRRDTAAARDWFRAVGLSGSFWGLDDR